MARNNNSCLFRYGSSVFCIVSIYFLKEEVMYAELEVVCNIILCLFYFR